MKHVRGVGVVANNGKVLMPASVADATSYVVSVFDEKESLKRVLVLLLSAGKSPQAKCFAFEALLEHEMLYGALDNSGARPSGLMNYFQPV